MAEARVGSLGLPVVETLGRVEWPLGLKEVGEGVRRVRW